MKQEKSWCINLLGESVDKSIDVCLDKYTRKAHC